MRKILLCTFALLSSLALSAVSQAQSAPTIYYTSPVTGPIGTSINIIGSNFGSTQGSSSIAFNGTTATPTSWSNTQIVAPVPSGATTGPIVVTVGTMTSNGVNFTVGTPPTIYYTSPITGPVGTSVTIVGTYFGSSQGSSTIAFNGTPATPTSWSSTQIIAPVPAGATTGPIAMTVGGVASNNANFTVGTPPTISYTNPIDGPTGTSVTIVGNYFGATQGSSTITFGGISATPTSWSNTQIVAPVPSGAATGPVVVTVGGSPSNQVNFIVGTPPTISYTSPFVGPVGTSITIVGNYFGSTAGNVTFNGTAATPASWSNTQIVVPVPSGASTGPLVVTAGGMASNSVNFTVGTPPTISYTNPVRAAVGSAITIVGNYFGSTQGSSTITFNGTPANPSSWSSTQIVVPIPAGSSTGPLAITVAGINSNGVNFTVTPNILGLSPSSAAVGSTVSISGTTFGLAQGSSTVTFNGALATPASWSDSQITVPVPTGASSGPLIVTTPSAASNAANFTLITGTPPTISAAVSPAPNASGWNNTNVTVTFTCTAGSAAIASCPQPQTISTEAANQVISGTATDVNGLTATASVTLNIDKTIPVLAVTSPADGTAFTTGGVTVSGTVSDALSGVSSVTCNGVSATFSSGAFSCNISLNVGVNLVVVRATDVAGNVAGSNFHLSLSGALPTPQSLQVTPSNVNMLINDTQQFTAVDDQGRPRPDATWSISDTTLATIDTNSSPTLIAVALGQVTLTASVQGLAAQAQINILNGSSLPIGTYRWAAPPVPGFTLYNMLEAAPASANTPDLYSVETGANNTALIRAFTADGQQMWQKSFSNFSYSVLPDAFGGLLVDVPPGGRIDLDGVTGSTIWQSQAAGVTIRQDGANVAAGPSSLTIFDGTTGQQVLNVPLQQPTETFVYTYGLPTTSSSAPFLPQSIGTPVASSDGSVYLLYSNYSTTDTQSRTTVNGENFFTDSVTTTYSLNLLTLSPAGTTQTQQITTATNTSIQPGLAIPDGTGGVLAVWTSLYANPQPFHVADVGPNGTTTYDLPLSGTFAELGSIALGTNGVAFATDFTNTAAFTVSSGQVLWSRPGSIIEATYGGGVSVFDSQNNVVQIDSQGNAGTPSCLGCLAPFGPSLWTTYLGAPGLLSGLAEFLPSSTWPAPNGDPQAQNQPPFCQLSNSHCVIAPHGDTTTPSDPLHAGAPMREVQYEVFSLQNGVLSQIGVSKIGKTKIVVLESNPTNPSTGICDQQMLDKGECQSPNSVDGPGFYTDDYTAGNTGPNTVTQQFFVDRGLVSLFWPQPAFDSQGFQYNAWYGAYSQTAALDRNNIPAGALIQQVNPDLQHAASCPIGCSLRQANGAPLQ